MELETLNCNNCGAPLQVPESANFVTCTHCNSQLAVKRTATAHYTEVLQRLDNRTSEMAKELRQLKLQNELMAIDEAWEDEQREYMITPSKGAAYLPDDDHVMKDMAGYAVVAVLAIGGLCVLASQAGISDFGGPILLFVLGVGGILGFAVWNTLSKARAYKEAEAAYYARRDEAARRLGGGGKFGTLSGVASDESEREGGSDGEVPSRYFD